MPPKTVKTHRCRACNHTQRPWFGICPECGEGGSAEEIIEAPATAPRAARPLLSGGAGASFGDLGAVSGDSHARTTSTIGELDRVLGGGIVPGSYIVLSAAPGAGKSTLMSQLLAGMAAQGRKVALVAAEESPAQVKLRFDRLGANGQGVAITSDTSVEGVVEAVVAGGYELVVVDSIQAVHSVESTGAPGAISQVQHCGQLLMRLAKEQGITVILIGQVTKDGSLAGPRLLEHMVDVVMAFEGDRDQQFRILRAAKNRFGSTEEIGVFEMTGKGLIPVEDPSSALGTRRSVGAIGAATCPVIEGSRPLLVEVQALVSATNLQQPIRACRGIDPKRFQMLCAVLSRRAKLRLGTCDVFLQVAGGIKIEDPALDLACCLAIVSAYENNPVPPNMAAFGEVSLLGEVRPAPQGDRRRSECQRLGYDKPVGAPNQSDLMSAIVAALGADRQVSTGDGDSGS